MKGLLHIFAFLLFTAVMSGCGRTDTVRFAHVEDGKFIGGDGAPYYFIGANFWYGPILGSSRVGGDRERLGKELDYLKDMGVCNLRVLVGSDGDYGIRSKVEPILQTGPGVYDDDLLDGLDYFIAEVGKRGMYAVLYLSNSWEWSGGWGQYLEWSGRGKYPIPAEVTWREYVEYMAQYHAADGNDPCKTMFADHVRYIVTRTNRYTGKPYSEDPAIFSWQICNEPRPFSKTNMDNFEEWIGEIARLIKSLDPNHMVSVGSEGEVGCERDIKLWRRIHAIPEIDYATIHAWPYNWNWLDRNDMEGSFPEAVRKTRDYIALHLDAMHGTGMPVVLEEFGFPRDGFGFAAGSPTEFRDEFYSVIFETVVESALSGGSLAGCNFWAWGGFARQSPDSLWWRPGDDYTGDPAQEEQGLYSVFAGDTTVGIIKNAADRIK